MFTFQAVLRKNKDTAKQNLDQFMIQVQWSHGNFFAIMRPCLNPVKYLNHQELDKDLLYLQKALEKKVPPESEDWHLPYLTDTSKGQVSSLGSAISSHVNLPENSFYGVFQSKQHWGKCKHISAIPSIQVVILLLRFTVTALCWDLVVTSRGVVFCSTLGSGYIKG